MSDERGDQMHGPEQVGGDYGRQHLVIERPAGAIAEHDPAVVDDDVQIWMLRDHLGHDTRNADGIGNIQLHGMHPGVSRRDLAQHRNLPGAYRGPGPDRGAARGRRGRCGRSWTSRSRKISVTATDIRS
jgi:hypothetical protein